MKTDLFTGILVANTAHLISIWLGERHSTEIWHSCLEKGVSSLVFVLFVLFYVKYGKLVLYVECSF